MDMISLASTSNIRLWPSEMIGPRKFSLFPREHKPFIVSETREPSYDLRILLLTHMYTKISKLLMLEDHTHILRARTIMK